MTHFTLTQSYAALPERFYAPASLTPVSSPSLIKLNTPLAQTLGLDPAWLASAEGINMLAGHTMPEGVTPIALAYAGHQFGHFVPQLGDGRAMLLGDVTDTSGHVREIQLKGAGRTAFSRRGDGRAALGPVLREYVMSEAMAALGVPTTRALAAVRTGERVYRETPLPGAVLARVAASHIRVGTFQFFAAREDHAGLRLLADYAIARHYPQAAQSAMPYLAFLESVIAAQAELVAKWMNLGFIHGVMNTDNMAISGATLDYGPCAFMEHYDPSTVFSFIDERGRYAYANQPSMALWDLTRLAEALLPLLAEEETVAIELAQNALNQFGAQFQTAYLAGMRAKIGLTHPLAEDGALVQTLLTTMHKNRLDFTQTFRTLSQIEVMQPTPELAEHTPAVGAQLPASHRVVSALAEWLPAWRHRLAQEGAVTPAARAAAMQAVNPLYIPRNHLVEDMISKAITQEDDSAFETLLAVTTNPYQEQTGRAQYARPAQPHEVVEHTFCGT
ncbi:YdiU family protein [Acetobacter orientalis]|uniref:protein adenylyltransferase SelO n=1 Tax=Acetobacter orientalis TaxID=146474 RepID=UPI0020A594C5|nr:YdiU family protein [Acetobacter orientalis]MCP1220744.1 YdiU family protein [Acetobacter orientalis]